MDTHSLDHLRLLLFTLEMIWLLIISKFVAIAHVHAGFGSLMELCLTLARVLCLGGI